MPPNFDCRDLFNYTHNRARLAFSRLKVGISAAPIVCPRNCSRQAWPSPKRFRHWQKIEREPI
jgi:hypothetical protein